MGATLGERKNVVNLFGFSQNTLLVALLAERVGRNESIPDTLPGPPVTAVNGWAAVVLFIPLGFQLGVFLTEPAIGQLWAAWVGAGPFWLLGHGITSAELQ